MYTSILSGVPATTAMVALALGYIVVTLANKEKEWLKAIGNIIGISIIVISGLLVLAKILWVATTGTKCGPTVMRQRMMMQQQQQMPLEKTP